VRPTSTRQMRALTISPPTFTVISRGGPPPSSPSSRHVVPVVVPVQLLLPPVQGQHLAEISFWYRSPTPTSGPRGRRPTSGGPREDSEPPGVDREPLVDPVLARKIGHPGAGVGRVGLLEPRPLFRYSWNDWYTRSTIATKLSSFAAASRSACGSVPSICTGFWYACSRERIQPDEELHRFPSSTRTRGSGRSPRASEFLRDVRSDVEMSYAHGYLVERSRVTMRLSRKAKSFGEGAVPLSSVERPSRLPF